MICEHCGEDIDNRGLGFDRHVVVCSRMPETDVMLRMFKRGRSFDDIGRQYGVSGKSVRRRIIEHDPFAYERKANWARGFGEGHCPRCGILLSVNVAQPVQDGLCAGCVYETVGAEVEVMA